MIRRKMRHPGIEPESPGWEPEMLTATQMARLDKKN